MAGVGVTTFVLRFYGPGQRDRMDEVMDYATDLRDHDFDFEVRDAIVSANPDIPNTWPQPIELVLSFATEADRERFTEDKALKTYYGRKCTPDGAEVIDVQRGDDCYTVPLLPQEAF